MRGFLTEGAVRLRRVDTARLEPQRETRAHVELRSRAAVDSPVCEPIRTGAAEIEARVSAQHIDRHPARVQGVDDEAAGADHRLDLRRRAGGLGRLEERLDL